MAITAAGVGSGLDIEAIIGQLMQLERRPLQALERRESEHRAELSAFGRLKSSISSFQSAMEGLATLDQFRVFSTRSSNDQVLAATADDSAARGTYGVEVLRLAQHHKVGTAELASDATFGSAGDALTLEVGGASMTLEFAGAMTLGEIRDAVNGADDNPGVTASILNTGPGLQRLVLTSAEPGSGHQISLSYAGSIDGNPFGFATANRDAQGNPLADLSDLDAELTVDGFPIVSGSNRAAGVIDGLTLELREVGRADLTVQRDTEAITQAAQAFVDAYNELQGTIKDLKAKELSGDGTLRSVQSHLRDVLNHPPSGVDALYTSLGELGITTQKDGTLSFDAADFQTALDQDFSGVAQLFANDDQGYAFRLAAVAGDLLGNDGMIEAREDSINDRIVALEDKQANFEYRSDR
jgi:flagellar hook-associated protein 2